MDKTRQAFLSLVRSGKATQSEAARLAGASRQLAHYWAKFAKINGPRARVQYLKQLWKQTLGE